MQFRSFDPTMERAWRGKSAANLQFDQGTTKKRGPTLANRTENAQLRPDDHRYRLRQLGDRTRARRLGDRRGGARSRSVGTCLNVGCIPSKMFVYAAEMAELASDSDRLGVHTRFDGADWPAIRDRIFGRIDPIAEGGRSYREGLPHVTVYAGSGRFVGHKQVAVGDEVITADRIVIAAGGRPTLPPVPGLADCGYHTSDTVMRLDDLPERLLVIGAGYIAAELGGVMGAFGSKVTFLLRGDTFLRREDHDISSRFTAAYSRRFDVRTHTRLLGARRENGEVVISLDRPGRRVLGAEGRRVAGGDRAKAEHRPTRCGGGRDCGRQPGIRGHRRQLRTNVEGVWALGDITNPVQLKHVANHEAKVVRHNLTNPDKPATVDHRFIPHAVFGYPQIASVGLTEQECRRLDIPYASHVQPYAAAAYGWAMEDTESAAKVIAHAENPSPDRRPHHRPAGAHPHPATHPGHALRPDRGCRRWPGVSTTSIPPYRRSSSKPSWNSETVPKATLTW